MSHSSISRRVGVTATALLFFVAVPSPAQQNASDTSKRIRSSTTTTSVQQSGASTQAADRARTHPMTRPSRDTRARAPSHRGADAHRAIPMQSNGRSRMHDRHEAMRRATEERMRIRHARRAAQEAEAAAQETARAGSSVGDTRAGSNDHVRRFRPEPDEADPVGTRSAPSREDASGTDSPRRPPLTPDSRNHDRLFYSSHSSMRRCVHESILDRRLSRRARSQLFTNAADRMLFDLQSRSSSRGRVVCDPGLMNWMLELSTALRSVERPLRASDPCAMIQIEHFDGNASSVTVELPALDAHNRVELQTAIEHQLRRGHPVFLHSHDGSELRIDPESVERLTVTACER